jgi:hypothetical protein
LTKGVVNENDYEIIMSELDVTDFTVNNLKMINKQLTKTNKQIKSLKVNLDKKVQNFRRCGG